MKDETIKLKKGTAKILAGPDYNEKYRDTPAYLQKCHEMNKETMLFIKKQIEGSYSAISKEAWDMDTVMVNFTSGVIIELGILIQNAMFENDDEFKKFWEGLLKTVLNNKMQK